MKKNSLPPAHLLPLVTTVERVYSETPTWLLAVALVLAMVAMAAFGISQQNRLDNYQGCIETLGASDPACVALSK